MSETKTDADKLTPDEYTIKFSSAYQADIQGFIFNKRISTATSELLSEKIKEQVHVNLNKKKSSPIQIKIGEDKFEVNYDTHKKKKRVYVKNVDVFDEVERKQKGIFQKINLGLKYFFSIFLLVTFFVQGWYKIVPLVNFPPLSSSIRFVIILLVLAPISFVFVIIKDACEYILIKKQPKVERRWVGKDFYSKLRSFDRKQPERSWKSWFDLAYIIIFSGLSRIAFLSFSFGEIISLGFGISTLYFVYLFFEKMLIISSLTIKEIILIFFGSVLAGIISIEVWPLVILIFIIINQVFSKDILLFNGNKERSNYLITTPENEQQFKKNSFRIKLALNAAITFLYIFIIFTQNSKFTYTLLQSPENKNRSIIFNDSLQQIIGLGTDRIIGFMLVVGVIKTIMQIDKFRTSLDLTVTRFIEGISRLYDKDLNYVLPKAREEMRFSDISNPESIIENRFKVPSTLKYEWVKVPSEEDDYAAVRIYDAYGNLLKDESGHELTEYRTKIVDCAKIPR